jgi:hypothetical protein
VDKPFFKKQMFNDGILEFSSFNYAIDFGLGRSKKIAQDKGPFEIKFNKQHSRDVKTYM